jgi:fructokinase
VKIVAVGELLWDIFADHERLGGAPFNFAVHAHRLGHDVIFASAVGDDDRGRRALEEVRRLGLSSDHIRVILDRPTGIVTITMRDGEPDYTIHRPAAYDFLEIPQIPADWLYYGTLAQHNIPPRPDGQGSLIANAACKGGAQRFYDLNLRNDSYSPLLVEQLLNFADAVKLNESELAFTSKSLYELRDEYSLKAAVVTQAERGCVVLIGDDYAEVPAHRVENFDPVGAGDAFAAAFLHGLNQGWPAAKIGEFANRIASRHCAV